MDFSVKLINVVFFLVFLIWVLKESLKRRRRRRREEGEMDFRRRGGRNHIHGESTVFNKITVLVNFIISISYLGYCLYEFLRLKTIKIDSLTTFLTWALDTVLVVYSFSRYVKEQRRWPSVLILWWIFAAIFDSLLLYVYLVTEFQFKNFPNFLPAEPNIIDLASFPFTVLLCFNALPNKQNEDSEEEEQEQEQPLLENYQLEQKDPFSVAGIWSKLTFRWLNPVFEKGSLEKLELQHLPEIPQSETADEAFTSLEYSLRKQKTHKTSLSDAILETIWRPLVINAAFAGNIYIIYIYIFLFLQYQ